MCFIKYNKGRDVGSLSLIIYIHVVDNSIKMYKNFILKCEGISKIMYKRDIKLFILVNYDCTLALL